MIIKNNHLISCSGDYSIKIWDLKNKKIVKVIEYAHNGKSIYTLSLGYLNNEEILLSGGKDSNIRFWDKNYNEIYCLHNGSRVYHMILSNNILIVGDSNKLINFYDIEIKSFINRIKTDHSKLIWKLLLLNSNDILVSGSADSNLKIWNIKNYSIKNSLKDNKCKFIIEGHKGRTRSIIQLKFDSEMIVSSDEYGTIMFHKINHDCDNNIKLIRKYGISHYDDNLNETRKDMFVKEIVKHKMLVSITSYSSLLFWNLSNYEIIRKVKIKFWLFTLIVLENDETILFTKGNSERSEIILWN